MNKEIFQNRVSFLPSVGKPNYIYYVPNGQGTDLDCWVTDKNGVLRQVKPILSAGVETDPIFTAWLAGPPNISEFTNDSGYLATVSVDGITITGTGTIGDPLISSGSSLFPVEGGSTIATGSINADLSGFVLTMAGGAYSFRNSDMWVESNSNYLSLGDFTDGHAQIYMDGSIGNRYIQFLTGGASRIFIDSSGNVGIGTITPTVALDIIGNSHLTGGLFFGTGGQNISRGSFDNSTGGDQGISLNCAVGYELNWQGGHLSSSMGTMLIDNPIQINSNTIIYNSEIKFGDIFGSAEFDAGVDSGAYLRLKTGNEGVGKVWTSDINGWGSWETPVTVTPAALTKTDDTNVTLTLGGTPATSLLENVSLTLGWTGTLADGRIASASTWNAKQDALSGTGFVKSTAGTISYDTSIYLTTSAAALAYQPLDTDLTTWAGITPGTGIGTALGVNVGTAGSVIVNGGALGTPSSGTLTNCTFPTLNQNTSGSAATLATPRLINGVSFNGSADISVTNKLQAYAALGSTILATNLDGDLMFGTAGQALTNQRVYFSAVWLEKGATLTGVKWVQITQGSYTANNYNGVGLYTYSGGTLTLVASSTDDGNIWKATTGTMSSKAFSSTYVATAGLYFVAFIYCRSAEVTAPSLGILYAVSSINTVTDFTNSAKTSALLSTQTALPSPTTTMAGLSAAATEYKIYLY